MGRRAAVAVVSVAVALAVTVAALLAAVGPAAAATTHVVTTSADSGPGSLRAALALAASDGDDSVIEVAEGVATVELETGLVLAADEDATHSLTVVGAGAVVTAGDRWRDGTEPLLELDGPAAIELRDITLTGAPGPTVAVAGGARPLDLVVDTVSITAGGGDGLRVVQATADHDVTVVVRHSRFSGNDGDGLRVAQRRAATLDVTIDGSVANANAASGMSVVASGSDGDLLAAVTGSDAAGNAAHGIVVERTGGRCCPGGVVDVALEEVVAEDNEGDGLVVFVTASVSDVAVALDAVTSQANGRVDDGADGAAVSVDSEGADVTVDVTDATFDANSDDGVEIDMVENAAVTLSVSGARFDDNNEDGLNLDTDVANGDYVVEIASSSFSGNGVTDPMGDGLDASNMSDVSMTVADSRFEDNADEGLDVFACCGPLTVHVSGSVLSGNAGDGAHLVVDTDAQLSARFVRSRVEDNAGEARTGIRVDGAGEARAGIRGDGAGGTPAGIRVDGTGEVSVFVLFTSVTGNSAAGFSLGGDGNGVAFVVFSDLAGNGGGKWAAGPAVVVLPIGS